MNELVESPFAHTASSTAVADTSGSRQAQTRELAEMQTKYFMAQQFPRDERKAMDGILNAFSRTGLAERAQYEYSKGGSNVSGLSIHAAQAIAQQWGNMDFGWTEISRGIGMDGVPYSEVRAFAVDLQSRTSRPLQFICRHWRDTKQGGYKIKDERDIYELCANMAQRRVRSCIMAVIPQDVQDSAQEQAEKTLKTKADTSPEAMAKMVDAFGAFGVTKEMIEKRIQRRLDAISPAQVVSLKRIYASLRDEMSVAAEWFDVIAADEQPAGAGAAAGELKGRKTTNVDAMKAKAPSGKPDPATGEIKKPDLAEYKLAIEIAANADSAALTMDEARSALGADSEEYKVLCHDYKARWSKK